MTSPKPSARLTGRAKILVAASIGAVALAGMFAVAANLGILTSADQSKVGTLSAAGDLLPTDTQVVDVYLDAQGNPVSSTSTAPARAQRFTVDAAGTVDVSTDGTGVSVDQLDLASGWTAGPVTTTSDGAAITFTNGTRSLDFTATVGRDGTVRADVTDSTKARPASRPADRHEADDDEGYEGGDSDD